MKNETRVYLIDLHRTKDGVNYFNLNNDEFMNIAEEQGYVYSLERFEQDYNSGELNEKI